MRTQTYIFLQKLKCPKCGRILAGGASHKIKSDKSYFYYRCENCKNNIHENKIEDKIKNLLADILEYDNVVNEFFLPVLKSKVDNPKEQLEKELKNLNNKQDRIRKAYIAGAFDLEEYNAEKKIVDEAISKIQSELNTTNINEELKFTPQDILLKRDIDFINSIKYPDKFKQRNKFWNEYTRDEKAELIMKYIEEIELTDKYGNYTDIEFIKFRESIASTSNDLYFKGYYDRYVQSLFGNIYGKIRFSEYLPEEEMTQQIMRLRQFYDVGYYEATYSVKDKVFYFNFLEDKKTIVRVFPLEDYRMIDPDEKMDTYNLGVLYVKEDNGTLLEHVDDVFKLIPAECDGNVVYSKEPILVESKPLPYYEDEENSYNEISS